MLVREGWASNQRQANHIRQSPEEETFGGDRYAFDIDVEALQGIPTYAEELQEIIEYQGEYLRLQPQDESDNSELVHVVIADRRFDNPWIKETGSPIYRQESDRK